MDDRAELDRLLALITDENRHDEIVVCGVDAPVYRPPAALILFGITFGFVVFPLVVWAVIWAFS